MIVKRMISFSIISELILRCRMLKELDLKIREIIAIGASIAANCQP